MAQQGPIEVVTTRLVYQYADEDYVRKEVKMVMPNESLYRHSIPKARELLWFVSKQQDEMNQFNRCARDMTECLVKGKEKLEEHQRLEAYFSKVLSSAYTCTKQRNTQN